MAAAGWTSGGWGAAGGGAGAHRGEAFEYAMSIFNSDLKSLIEID